MGNTYYVILTARRNREMTKFKGFKLYIRIKKGAQAFLACAPLKGFDNMLVTG